jgi:MazG family protein
MTEIDHLLNIMSELRKKCPWDAKQTHESLKRYLLEETYETLESIDNSDFEQLKSELGDLILQIVFHSEIASEKEAFKFADVVSSISTKMVDRHPHVFKDNNNITAEQVQNNWEKSKHKKEKRNSILSGVPLHLPALLKAQRMQEKAATLGFDWSDKKDVIAKLDEEVSEFKEALKGQENIADELGDIFFTLVNIARFFSLNAEETLQKANSKFLKRFAYIEKHFNNDPAKLEEAGIDKLDALWEESKGSIK